MCLFPFWPAWKVILNQKNGKMRSPNSSWHPACLLALSKLLSYSLGQDTCTHPSAHHHWIAYFDDAAYTSKGKRVPSISAEVSASPPGQVPAPELCMYQLGSHLPQLVPTATKRTVTAQLQAPWLCNTDNNRRAPWESTAEFSSLIPSQKSGLEFKPKGKHTENPCHKTTVENPIHSNYSLILPVKLTQKRSTEGSVIPGTAASLSVCSSADSRPGMRWLS